MDFFRSEGRLLPNLVDELAVSNPGQLYCIHAKSHKVDDGWHEITFQSLANAVNRLTWWINECLNGDSTSQILAYVGANDLRYSAFILACAKLGHVALLLSTRNSQTAFRHLLLATNCSIVVDGAEKLQLKQALDELVDNCKDISLRRWSIAPLAEVFAEQHSPVYPSRLTFKHDEDRTAIIIHSSGTTGLPKPVHLSHGYLSTIDNMQYLPIPVGRKSAQMFLNHKGDTRLMYGPLFHFIGLVCMMECIFFKTPFLLVPDGPLTDDVFEKIMTSPFTPRWGLMAPWVLEELSSSEKGRKSLSKLQSLNYGGAPLSTTAGERAFRLLRLQTLMGSSETAYTPTLLCEDPNDWEYMEWNPYFQIKMDSGLYELVIPRQETRHFHGIFHTAPDLDEYRTGDLFQPHSSKPTLWKYEGRRDDIIVLSNGEKFNPIDAEQQIRSSDWVKSAAIFGQDRFHPSLIIEPHWDQLPSSWTEAWLKEQILPAVQRANSELPAHGKILESNIAFAVPEKPFQVSPKGTLRRKDIQSTYLDTLDQLYVENTPSDLPGILGKDVALYSLPELQQWLENQISRILGFDIGSHENDLIGLGLDSLQAMQIVKLIQEVVIAQPTETPFKWTTVQLYKFGNPKRIAQELYAQLKQGESVENISKSDSLSFGSRDEQLATMVRELSGFPPLSGINVALTGSTGELGSYLLHSLLQSPLVNHVFCLNRAHNAGARQKSSFREKGLSEAGLERVTFLHTRLDAEFLGLEAEPYSRLRESVDIIIHNAWHVSFNLPVASFKPHIIGTRRILELASHSTRSAEIHFISSVAVVTGKSTGFVKELLHDASFVLQQGYGESKFVAEQMCGIASMQSKSRVAIHRIGQLGGPSSSLSGMWNPRDWFPTLVQSSQMLSKLPDSLGAIQVDWLPIDTAAKAIVEIIQSRIHKSLPRLTVYHVKNPHATEWKTISGLVAKACNAQIVTMQEWISSVETVMLSKPALSDGVSAVNLLEFFTEMLQEGSMSPLVLETHNAERDSTILHSLKPVDEGLVELWLKQWQKWLPDLFV
ncbi:NRPS-like enzyme [Penicillium macrosclerotiorum]|uniref:NRPS-like enzyme n=1 Tax=Penicillium macrosclerotiorum TaxID=303699 RepID=UPI0025497C7D|nr:NRPS-like enzyme [Penicillium macrosclerotiorum]KAJ5692441.1 NRPS-like enzyme [Penicillium macrosclerotiorum]